MVTCDETDKRKPYPYPLLIAMRRLDSRPEETLMVGDSTFDIESARSAGVRSVLVGWQMALTEEEIQGETGPDHVIASAEDLLLLL